jgi:hypothetical protein
MALRCHALAGLDVNVARSLSVSIAERFVHAIFSGQGV